MTSPILTGCLRGVGLGLLVALTASGAVALLTWGMR